MTQRPTGYEDGVATVLLDAQEGSKSLGVGRGMLFNYIRIMALCTVAGYLLASLFMTPGGANIGAAKGLLIGIMVAWGEWKSRHPKPVRMRPASVRLTAADGLREQHELRLRRSH